MKIKPFKHKAQRPFREISMHDSALNIHRDLILSINGMEMRGRMLPRKDADHDPEKPGNLRHGNRLAPTLLFIMGVTAGCSGAPARPLHSSRSRKAGFVVNGKRAVWAVRPHSNRTVLAARSPGSRGAPEGFGLLLPQTLLATISPMASVGPLCHRARPAGSAVARATSISESSALFTASSFGNTSAISGSSARLNRSRRRFSPTPRQRLGCTGRTEKAKAVGFESWFSSRPQTTTGVRV